MFKNVRKKYCHATLLNYLSKHSKIYKKEVTLDFELEGERSILKLFLLGLKTHFAFQFFIDGKKFISLSNNRLNLDFFDIPIEKHRLLTEP